MTFLKRKRREQNLTALELSEKTGINRTAISAIENDSEILGAERARKIGEGLGIPEDVLTVFRGEWPPYAMFALKLFPDVVEENLKNMIFEVMKTAVNNYPMLNKDLKKTISENSNFFKWFKASRLSMCASCHTVAIFPTLNSLYMCQICEKSLFQKFKKNKGEFIEKEMVEDRSFLLFIRKLLNDFEPIQNQQDFEQVLESNESLLKKLDELQSIKEYYNTKKTDKENDTTNENKKEDTEILKNKVKTFDLSAGENQWVRAKCAECQEVKDCYMDTGFCGDCIYEGTKPIKQEEENDPSSN